MVRIEWLKEEGGEAAAEHFGAATDRCRHTGAAVAVLWVSKSRMARRVCDTLYYGYGIIASTSLDMGDDR